MVIDLTDQAACTYLLLRRRHSPAVLASPMPVAHPALHRVPALLAA